MDKLPTTNSIPKILLKFRDRIRDRNEAMSLEPKIIQTESNDYPSILKKDKKAGKLFPKIYALGNIDISKKPLLGLFCSVKCPGDLILRTYDLARVLREKGVPVISGFHTPIEKDCLDLLLRGVQPLICCPARGIQGMRLSTMESF